MADHVLFIGWNRPVAGREARAVELFHTLTHFLDRQRLAGHIESFEPVMLGVHGGDLNGFILIRGDKQKLGSLRASNEFIDIVTQCAMNIEGFGVIDGFTGDGVRVQMARYHSFIGNRAGTRAGTE
jgi:hypothetical protein